ncbi:MAG: hypothetical protein ACR2MG_14395 [Pyrinomonadaceae bacterium]
MKKKLLVLIATVVLCLLATNFVSAQDKHIRLVKGKKLVLKGNVSDQADRSYFFKAKKGQNIIIKLIGRDAVFILFAQHNFDAETFSEETKLWSGKLPNADSGEYAIRLSSYHKVASYTLEILLR